MDQSVIFLSQICLSYWWAICLVRRRCSSPHCDMWLRRCCYFYIISEERIWTLELSLMKTLVHSNLSIMGILSIPSSSTKLTWAVLKYFIHQTSLLRPSQLVLKHPWSTIRLRLLPYVTNLVTIDLRTLLWVVIVRILVIWMIHLVLFVIGLLRVPNCMVVVPIHR